MKQYLLPQEGHFYKANLHCHSRLSDGCLTPQEIKDRYQAKGYSIVAFTDHDIFLPHPELTDASFLALHGYEMEVNEPKMADFSFIKTCHMCMIALDPKKVTPVCWHRSDYLFGNAVSHRNEVAFDESEPDYIRSYTPECINDMMKRGREAGFFVTYNHPVWSLEDYPEFSQYEGMHAMEIYNHGCYEAGYPEYNPIAYDSLLRQGKRIYCLATDDNHNYSNAELPESHDSFGGFVMIKAPALEYTAVTDALVKGNFYSSTGPQIKSLYVEDGMVYVQCSPAVRVTLTTGIREVYRKESKKSALVTEASFPVKKNQGYFRITVIDENGRAANTNAYFVDQLSL